MRIKLEEKSTLWKIYEGKEKFCFCISFEFQCYVYLSTWTVKKKREEKRNGRKKNDRNKKKNTVHTSPIGKNDAPRFILFRYVDSRITL